MHFGLDIILALTIVIPLGVAIIRWVHIGSVYVPFICLLAAGLINELISIWSITTFGVNAINTNIYSLTEAGLIAALFTNWIPQAKTKIWFVFAGLAALWFAENFIISTIYEFNTYFPVIYSLLIVFLSLVSIIFLLFKENLRLFKNARFIISCLFVVSFAYSAGIELFWHSGMAISEELASNIYLILSIITAVNNLIFIYAILCMEKKVPFSFRS